MKDPSLPEESIFGQALEIMSAAERVAFLDRACGNNQALRAEVEALLRAHDRSGDLLDIPEHAQHTTDQPASELPGTVIGPYKLLEQIGEGGFGVVFMAEQQQPVRRKVALKVLKPGMDTKQVIARFEAERQALALMDHPNIAHVLDGGETISGRPYFVMDLVRGVPITDFCDENHMPVTERLELFLSVCHAVQHAHQKGIIHRDLKPSNVLVTINDDVPVAKVIDFGVAKATGQQLTDKTLFTNFAQMVGTPIYMSPEQALMSGLDVDTRSDIYSLGVLLYELLTGTTPFTRERLKTVAYDEMRRIIREEEPPKPSTRISTLGQAAATISTNRKTDPTQLRRLFRGELDWIVMKCLEKDRNRRYETANGLAMDVQRYLHDEPVLACPPSTGYRLRKFARKYRTALRIAGAFVVFLLLAAAVSIWQAVRATLAEGRALQAEGRALQDQGKALRERDRAEASFRMAREAVDQLFTQVSQSPKLKAQPMEKFRKELLQSAKGFYERFVREQFDAPEVRHDLALAYQRLAEIDRELGDYAAAEESSRKAIALLGELIQEQPDMAYESDQAAGYTTLGRVHVDTAHWQKADEAFQHAMQIQERLAETDPQADEVRFALAKSYHASGYAHHRAGHPEIAERRYQKALDLLNHLDQDHPGVSQYQSLMAAAQFRLGELYITTNRPDQAESPLKGAESIYRRLVRGQDVPAEHWFSLGQSLVTLGVVYKDRRQFKDAEAAQQEALKIFEKLAKEHGEVLEYLYGEGRCHSHLGGTAYNGDRLEDALASFDRGIKIMAPLVGKGYLRAQMGLWDAQIMRALVRAKRRDHARATEELEELARQGDLVDVHVYNIACAFSQCLAAADRDTKLSTAERSRLKTRYADQAMKFLIKAIDKGYHYPRKIRDDPDLEPLKTRKDFMELLAELEAKESDKQ
jgi:serine/threonine protein kinase/tetratricopeptide (TPR) repeat protein